MNRNEIKKVHVVYKTHLDIGFTDLGQTVLDRYVKEYIPHSVALAKELNTREHKMFIWTVGSFLIDHYMKHADENGKKELTEAIEAGDICWHGIASTTHTELLDMDLFRYSLSIGQKYDKQFGRKTIAAKMTDVPGHSIAIVEPLAEAGIEFLHIGVNASSMVPGVPETFVWKHGDKSILVQYSAQYGAPGYVEGMDEVLEFAHTGDNLGPQSEEDIRKEFERIQALYPNAVVEASTMDDYARSLLKVKSKLPVIEEEIGDTWIHGVASDPWKVGRYEALIQLKNQWKMEGKLREDTPGYEEFMTNLMLIAEHTWGLDYKKYLADFKHWKKAEFQEARKRDVTTLELLTNRNAQMREVLDLDFKRYRGGTFTGSYSFYESSHEEQRQYLKAAAAALPEELKQEAEETLAAMKPVWEDWSEEKVLPGQTVEIAGWRIRINGDGSIEYLEKNGKDWAKDGAIGTLSYETFCAVDCVNNYYRYNRDFYETGCWSEGDFSKPGLEFAEDLEHRMYGFYVQSIRRKGQELLITLAGNEKACSEYGCPRKAQIRYEFLEKEIKSSLTWFEKDANRMPEAMWFTFALHTENPNRFQMQKMGTSVSPLDVVKGGNRLQHCAQVITYAGADGKARIESIHAPLVSVGGSNLYDDYRIIPDLSKGFAYNLFNNKWGTNFKMWCEDDCRFEFVLKLESY